MSVTGTVHTADGSWAIVKHNNRWLWFVYIAQRWGFVTAIKSLWGLIRR